MNLGRSNTRSNDLPIDESTQVEKTPLRRLRQSLFSKLGLRGNSPAGTPPAKRNHSNTKNLSKLDPQVYLDTQSNGFASRVVKYHEASEAKSREITNKAYRRPGDFPIVNLDKSEINLNKKQALEPKVAKINISSPVNLISASNATARSAIFRTGKNYGENYPTGKIGPIEGRKPIKPTISPDEPIVLANNDYDNTPTRSSLEALKEISRKRIHCDEIDGDTNKKQRPEHIPNEYDPNNPQTPGTSKRPRDRTSPSYNSSSAEIQKKRYKNNDILSSLSSSILFKSSKQSAFNVDANSTSKHQLAYDSNEKIVKESESAGDVVSNKRPQDSSRVGTSNSDLPLHRPSEQIIPVTKSMSDGHVPIQPASKAPKITLFNKDYSAVKSSNNNNKLAEDDEDNSISFVKPKAKTTNIFSLNKNRDQKSKLAMMLSFLRGDESKDEVDSVKSSSSSIEKPDQTEKPKENALSTSVNLSTTTSVTFSTATTTSLLNVPSTTPASIAVVKPNPTEPAKPSSQETLPKETSSLEETSKPSVTLPTTTVPTATVVSTPLILPVSTVTASSVSVSTLSTLQQSDKQQTSDSNTLLKPSSPRTVTFSLPTNATSTITSPTSSNRPVPSLGGFAFTPTVTPTQIPAVTPSITKPVVQDPISKPAETQPKFLFGSNPTSSVMIPVTTTPSNPIQNSTNTFGSSTPSPFTFGATSAPPVTTVAATPSTTTTSMGIFGNSITNANTSTNTSFVFGQPSAPAVTTISATPSTTTTSTGIFGNSSTNTNTSTSTSFVFGQSNTTGMFNTKPMDNTKTNTALNAPPAYGTTTPALNFSAKPAFGSQTETKPAFGSQPELKPVFGSQAVAKTGAFSFNAQNNPPANVPAFGSTPSAPAPAPQFGSTNGMGSGSFSFGANNNAGQNPTNTFGSQAPSPFGFGTASTTPATTISATPVTTASTGMFGSASSTNTNTNASAPFVFGQSNTGGMFGTKPVENTNTISASNAPPAFGSTSSAFNFSAKPAFGSQTETKPAFGSQPETKPTAFSFNAQTNSPANVPSFGSTSSTPQFGSTNGMGSGSFSFNANNNPNQNSTNAFGSPAPSPFGFGAASTTPVTTASTGMFGNTSSTNTNASTPFVFGQNNTGGMFDTKPVDNANSALSAPPAFGSTSPAFNFSAKPAFGTQPEAKPAAFTFNAQNNAPANVPTFGSTPTAPQFGSTNGMGSNSFAFNANNNPADASKPFNFGAPATAPAASTQPFSFSPASPPPNAFQFNATPQMQQPATANIFSIGPGDSSKTGRPIRTATRRLK